MFFDSRIGKRLITEKSTLFCPGPRKTLRPTLPRSVQTTAAFEHVVSATAAPPELGIACPPVSLARANANGLKKYPAGMLLVAVPRVEPGAQLARAPPPVKPYSEPAPASTTSIGRPDMAVMMPDSSQLVNNRRLGVERLAKAGFGNSQR